MRSFVRLAFAVLLLLQLLPADALAQPVPDEKDSSILLVPPAYLLRFRISNQDLGYLLTPIYAEGVAHGYVFERVMATLYPVIPGYAPDPAAGVLPLHQWTVVESGRPYTYYSLYYSVLGANYHYDGVRGYLFPPSSTVPGHISVYYSQTKGFFFGYGAPPLAWDPPVQIFGGGAYSYQGLLGTAPYNGSPVAFPSFCPTQSPCYVPNAFAQAVVYREVPPPPPPTGCNPQDAFDCQASGWFWNENSCTCTPCDPEAEQSCQLQGGYWEMSSCSCSYLN